MKVNQKLYTKQGVQVALFPLYSFIITQKDTETFSHDPTKYYATDYQSFNYTSGSDTELGTGTVQRRASYYAPCDVICVGMDKTNASILWRSQEKVLLANGKIDYLIILFYHDNDVQTVKFNVGDTRKQGEEIGKTGTGGNVTGDHVHIETGYGENWNKVYVNPSWGHINLDYALHNYEACYGNDTIDYGIVSYPDKYPWVYYDGETPIVENKNKSSFPWVLYANKIRNKNN